MLDRRAALLASGLAGLDDETLEYLASSPATVLTQLYERSAAAFAAFGGSLRMPTAACVPPGGSSAVPLWESVVGARSARPTASCRCCYGEFGGRLAYVFDTIAAVEPPPRPSRSA